MGEFFLLFIVIAVAAVGILGVNSKGKSNSSHKAK